MEALEFDPTVTTVGVTSSDETSGLTSGVTSGVIIDTRDRMFDVIADIERVKNTLTAFQLQVLSSAHDYSTLTGDVVFGERDFRVEFATVLRIPESTAGTMIAVADALAKDLPATLAALRDGSISYRHVQKLVDHAETLPEEARRPFEQAVLPAAETLTVAKFDNRARRLRERIHPESITERKKTAFEKRSVSTDPARDGMAWITALLPAEQVHAIDNRLDDIAHSLHPDDTRTLPQRRADAFADLLINGDPANAKHRGIRAEVNVTIPWLTLLGRSDEPAELHGYGPIPAEVARELCADATSFTRILTDPITGTILALDRTKRLPTTNLRRWVILRDGTCRFPGCNRKARTTDIDHIIPWDNGGPTDADNLECLCQHHHRMKHNTHWTVTHRPGGILEWTSPDGKHHETRPELELELELELTG